MANLKMAILVFTYVLALGFLGLFAVLTWKMANNTIHLEKLVSEPDGKASISRFQFLVFTLVVAGLYVILSIDSGQLLEVPAGALALLGISGGSFIVSKGIGLNAEKREGSADATPANPKE
jgi:hypothetical protein